MDILDLTGVFFLLLFIIVFFFFAFQNSEAENVKSGDLAGAMYPQHPGQPTMTQRIT